MAAHAACAPVSARSLRHVSLPAPLLSRGPARRGGRKLGANALVVCAAEPQVAAEAATEEGAAFGELAAAHLDSCLVTLQRSEQGNGLFFTQAPAAGDVVLRVPLGCCLVVDYTSGMQLPNGAWPRLRRGVQQDDALPWDVLQALALLDSLSGGGDALWERYANAILPHPLALTLPLCFPPDLMTQLQHAAIIEGAQAQQQRLAALFPALSGGMCEGGPSWLQWAFACVRSRSFKLREDCFAFVPFLDLANHAPDPTCDFRLSGNGSCVELVALKQVAAGQEATISYTGPQGLTNQRLMAQYGFVPAQGNPADRLLFSALQTAAAEAAGAPAAAAAAAPGGVLLSLDRVQQCLGEGEVMAAAMSGRDPYAYAALKSLPLAAEESTAADVSAQLVLTERLYAELAAEADSWPSTLAADTELRQQLLAQSASGGGSADARLLAAVQYRQQRKALVRSAMAVLRSFIDL